MQRNQYGNMPPATSPPLHHPVPQHVSTVPQLRSPPPPMPQHQQQQSGGYGNPYQPQAGGNAFGAYGGFINDPTAQMGFQVGQTALKHGTEYVEQNFNRYVNVSALKHYFNVSNSYVVNKLFLVLFPWRHKPWSRKQSIGPNGQEGWFLPPRDDLNSPDMYIPVMALVTYILLSSLLAGLRGSFQPELFGYTATWAFFIVVIEILGLKLGCYLLSISNESQLLDLVAYSGYKFVGVIVTLVVSEIFNGGKGTGGWVGWTIFGYCFAANALFLQDSLEERFINKENSINTLERSENNSHKIGFGNGPIAPGVAFVTGGGLGLGNAIAVSFAREGARGVVIVDINESSLEQGKKVFKSYGTKAVNCTGVFLSTKHELRQMMKQDPVELQHPKPVTTAYVNSRRSLDRFEMQQGRKAKAEEVGDVAVLITSPRMSLVNGADLFVNGVL
ncbi:hypothetical protein G7Y89_g5605 [Cudoniella acicularis]|uniref:Uncharacterized protein n=1 Tax=Cudoniella acicularis TaxID=354080 RepID=A0A8H4RNJ7_9HELO|nr:hypothetical protein G7Y89_g5605 [Cudoniella acicularis]